MKLLVFLLVQASAWVFCVGVSKEELDEYLNVCLDSKHHKEKPGAESSIFAQGYHCAPWKDHACCTANTTKQIQDSGTVELYNMHWDQCGKTMSPSCRRYFEMDTCFYECSPNVRPWIVVDKKSKKTRRERMVDVPVCATECDAWFEACKDDLTCSNNWGNYKTWNYTSKMCKMECKTFKEYFETPSKFCAMIFNHSFKYANGKPGEDCMVLWPNATSGNINAKVARRFAEKQLTTGAGCAGLVPAGSMSVLLALFAAVMGNWSTEHGTYVFCHHHWQIFVMPRSTFRLLFSIHPISCFDIWVVDCLTQS